MNAFGNAKVIDRRPKHRWPSDRGFGLSLRILTPVEPPRCDILQDLDIDFGKAIGAEQPVAVTKEER